MATTLDTATKAVQGAQDQYFRLAEQVPVAVWYGAALTTIVASATLYLFGQRDWSTFVGQWPPTFLLLGLYHKLLGTRR